MSKPELMTTCKTEFNSLAHLHEIACDIVESAYKEYGQTPPFWIIGLKGGYIAIATPWANHAEQLGSPDVIAALLKVFRAHAYAFACEYTAVHLGAATEEEAAVLRAEMPDRLENLPREMREDSVLVMSQPKKGGEPTMARYLVNNNNGSYQPFLGPRIDEQYPVTKGRMHNLFKHPVNDSEILRRMISRFKESMKHAL